MSYLELLLQGCHQVLERCKKTYFKAVHHLCKSPQRHKPPYSADANIDSTDSTTRRCCACGVGVRASAPLRRGAAPYADGSLRSQPPSHLIFLPILSGGKRFEGGIL